VTDSSPGQVWQHFGGNHWQNGLSTPQHAKYEEAREPF